MEQYMAQFTGEEPAQIRQHNRVAELEREVERWEKNAWDLTRVRHKLYEALEIKNNELHSLKQRAEELERTLAWYANAERYKTVHGDNAILTDAGQRARKALNSE